MFGSYFHVSISISCSFYYFIHRYIKTGSTIISDYWKAYNTLSTLNDRDYEHLKVNHSLHFVNGNGDHTNKIEGNWRHAKVSMPPFGARKHHFAGYLAEFMWRSSKEKTCDVFINMIEDISSIHNVSTIVHA